MQAFPKIPFITVIDSKEFTDVISVDLPKAFDTAGHNISLEKLHVYGARGTALTWLKSYLNNRPQFVEFNGQ